MASTNRDTKVLDDDRVSVSEAAFPLSSLDRGHGSLFSSIEVLWRHHSLPTDGIAVGSSPFRSRSRGAPSPKQLRLITNMALLNSQHTLYVLKAQPHTLPTSQQLRRLEHILNLPPIHLIPRQHIEFLVAEAMALGRGVEEIDPDVAARGFAELAVAHADVDAGLEGGVDVVDAVGSEEEDAFVVLEDAEEDGDEFVALQVVRAALFEEDVGFVEEEDSVPFAGHF